MKDNKVYITSAGSFLPGEPVSNEKMEAVLGMVNNQPSRTRELVLRQNGIQQRHYALDENQTAQYQLSEMTAKAIDDCLKDAPVNKQEVSFLSAATTQGDLPVPGFASMVHGESGLERCEISTHHGVCGSGMMALKNAWLNVRSGEHKTALACAGEFASRMFKKQRFEGQEGVGEDGRLPFEVDFLRWMLSDGSGALLLQNEAAAKGLSLEIKWVDIQSNAHRFEECMYAGQNKEEGKSWLDYNAFSHADAAGAINLKQDIKIVDNIVKLGVQRYFELIDEGKIKVDAIDHFLCHYSSHYFRKPIIDLLEKGGGMIPEEKWYTNLYQRGNTGSASIYIMLEEFLRTKDLKAGQQVLCMVPESGRFLTSFMMLEVVEGTSNKAPKNYYVEPKAPEIHATGGEVQQWLVRELTKLWVDFETRLNKVPVVEKLNRGMLTLEEYKLLILNIRQQVIDGSQWIARAASNVSMEFFDIRSAFISHSADEHKDYQILEKNYLNLGGAKEDLYNTEKNLGSEALSAYMFHRASQANPFDLLGGMFIIEGLGNRVAGKWGRAIKDQLDLDDNQVSFLIYHESSDANDNHFARFENAVNSEMLTMELAKRVVKTAKTVGRLYVMQLEELGNY